ncbi:MAG: hypothetical protein ACM30E_12015 [Nitrososphaerales archaeon]
MRTHLPRSGDGWSEDTRITYFKQVAFWLGIVLCLFAAGSSVARADSADPAAGTAAVSIVPADGKPRGIRLRAQTVSTVITEDAAGVWADTDLEVQLQNRGKVDVVLPLGLPGPQPHAYVTTTLELPQIVDISADKKPLSLTALAPGQRPGLRATAVITLPVESTVAVRVRYRQAVAVRDDLAAYVYPLTAGTVWAGTPESLAVSLTFKTPTAAEQLMYLATGAQAPKPGVYSWRWNGVKPPSDVAAVFVTQDWWRQLAAMRESAGAPDAGLREHAALAEAYWRLATLAPPAFAPRASFYDGSFPLALAAWRAAIASAGGAASPLDLARARERLAGLYLAQGSREGGAAASTYLQLAVDELAVAVALDPADEDLAASAAALQQRLAQAAASRGDGATAAVHTARVRALTAGQSVPSATQEAQQTALSLAEAAVASGDLPGARSLLEESFGPEMLQLADARRPAITQALLRVWSRPSGRKISLQLVDDEQGRSADGMIRETVEALRRVAPVAAAGSTLTVTLAYTDPAALLAAQDRLGAALPRLPELALLSSALTTRRLDWPQQAGLLSRTSRYEERVDLSRSAVTWYAEAGKLEAAAAEVAGSSEPLDRIRAALWRADARAWRDLAALSKATYQVELQEQGEGPAWLQARVHQFYREGSVDREWVVRAGETRQLEAGVLGWRYDRVALVAVSAVVLAALAFGLLWFVSR